MSLQKQIICDLKCDKTFLEKLFNEASKILRNKISQKDACAETLKTLNCDVVECNTLLQQCQSFIDKFDNADNIPALFKCLNKDLHAYFKNLYKKKRIAATHVLVKAVSDEQRRSKPYTLPVQFIPYKSLRDQFIRDLTLPLKKAMTDAGLEVVGKLTWQALPNTHIKYEMLKKIDYVENTDHNTSFLNENLKNTYYFVQLITSSVIVLKTFNKNNFVHYMYNFHLFQVQWQMENSTPLEPKVKVALFTFGRWCMTQRRQ